MKDICHESDREKMREIKEEKPFQFPTLSRAPRLSIFSGESTTKENEVNYELWKYEVECLCKTDIPSSYILEAIRHSLEGETGLIIMKMGHDVDIGNILGKLDSIYGSIDKKETIFAEFSSAKQRKNGLADLKTSCHERLNTNRYIIETRMRCSRTCCGPERDLRTQV